MLVWDLSLEHAGCVWRLAAVFVLAMVLRRSKLKLGMDEIVVFPFNKPVARVGGSPD